MNPIQLEKLYEYQLQLVSRRWQYFFTYLGINGLLLTTLPSPLMNQLENKLDIPTIPYIAFPTFSVIVALAFSLLTSLATTRIQKTEALIGKELSVVQFMKGPRFLGLSETVIIYFCIYVITGTWVALAFYIKCLYGVVLSAFLLINTFLLKWRV